MTPNIAAIASPVVVSLQAVPTRRERDTPDLASAEFACANCFVRLSALIAAGGFGRHFTSAGRENLGLQFWLMERGGERRIDHAAQALALRPSRRAGWGISVLQQRQVQFDDLLCRKHSQLHRARLAQCPRYDRCDHDLIATVLAVLFGTATAGYVYVAATALVLWAALTLRFCMQKLHGGRRTVLLLRRRCSPQSWCHQCGSPTLPPPSADADSTTTQAQSASSAAALLAFSAC